MTTELARGVARVREQDVVERIKEAVVPVLTKHGRVVAAYVFGSAGTERATAMSDVDIAVLTDSDISLLDELSLSADVAVALGREDVDLLVFNSARNDLQHAVISEGVLILYRDPLRTSDFIERVLSIHKDYGKCMKTFLSERILHKLQTITGSLSKLEELARMDRDVFLTDFRSIDSAKYNLQTSIEAMIDICNHIISRKRLRVPATNVESFEIVSETGLLPADALPVYRSMARFRNRIVHMYDEVDDSQIHEILQNRPGDIRAFVQSVVDTSWS